MVAAAARRRAAGGGRGPPMCDDTDDTLALAADQFIVTAPSGPTVVAGYPWFGDWSRDTMTSYEGLFLAPAGRRGPRPAPQPPPSLSEGMLANTADAGGPEYNTVDGTLWFLHAVGRHVARTSDVDLGAELRARSPTIVEHHESGTRFGIRVDGDGLLTQGADGLGAHVDGRPRRRRAGHAPPRQAGRGQRAVDQRPDGRRRDRPIDRRDPTRFERLAAEATRSFQPVPRPDGHGLFDVVDGPEATTAPSGPTSCWRRRWPSVRAPTRRPIVAAIAPLVTSIGLRSLSPDDAPTRAGTGAMRLRETRRITRARSGPG